VVEEKQDVGQRAGAESGSPSGSGDAASAAASPYLESKRTTSESAAASPYLESKRTTSEELEVTGVPTGRVRCKRVGCGCVWCSKGCGLRKGLALRDCLKRELESFKSPYFVTLTIDRERFPGGPEEAMEWVQSGGVISEFVRILRRGGFLLDSRYFQCSEFQDDGGWPHWHLVFDAEFVPFFDICDAWAAAGWSGRAGRERWGERPISERGGRPVFGSVSFRVKGKSELGRICHYLTKYLTKMPAAGWPAWVQTTSRQLRRWSTSRDFWRASPPPVSGKKVTEFSKLRGKYFDPNEEWEEDDQFLRKIGKTKKSIAQRLDSCGSTSVLLDEVELPPGPGETKSRIAWRYAGMISSDVWADPRSAAPTFSQVVEMDERSFVVDEQTVTRLGVPAVGVLRSLARFNG
jgi:hypothetical protein